MKLEITHYGAFRALGGSTSIDVCLPATIGEVRRAMIELLGNEHKSLIEDSAFASETDVLTDACVLDVPCALSVLPPVCGG